MQRCREHELLIPWLYRLFISTKQSQCSRLSQIFPSALHYPGTDNFTIWDAKQQETVSACRLQPADAPEVSQALSVLRDTSCQFAVKGGGHSRSPNDSKSAGGVTIDLGRIVDVAVAADRNSARLGGGLDLQQAFQALEAYNVSFPGGRVGSVGVGGFTLGGGSSPFSPRHGWALDNVLEYEVCPITLIRCSDTLANSSQRSYSPMGLYPVHPKLKILIYTGHCVAGAITLAL